MIAAARACRETPFRHQGRLPGRGLDCAGVLIHVGNLLGLAPKIAIRVGATLRTEPSDHFDVTGYAHYPRESEVRRWLRFAMDPIHDFAARKPGDAVVFADAGHAVHMGILAIGQSGEEVVIHAMGRAPRRVVEHIVDAHWRGQIRAVYRFRGLEDE